MNSSYYFFFMVALVLLELLYFRIARHYSILDHPNNRSLHGRPTIRGGGIIFYLTVALFFFLTSRPDPLLMVSVTLVALVGFIDDVRSLSSVLRFIAQSLAFGMAMMTIDFSEYNTWMIVFIFIVSVGALNTFNFMDGINGLTGGYGLVALGSLLYINQVQIHFIEYDFMVAVIMGVAVFCFFNFRTKAVCFAGDVGSLTLGFIIIYLIVALISLSGNYAYAFLLSVYGVDSVMTIIHRLIRQENIFKAHKLHLYQVTVTHFSISHVRMSLLYTLVQLAINAALILSFNYPIQLQFDLGFGLTIILMLVYLYVKVKLLKALPLG